MTLTLQLIFNSLSHALIYSSLAVGLSVYLGVLRILNFAQGDFSTAGGYAVFTTISTAGLGLALGAAVGLVVGALIGVIFFLIIVFPLRNAPELNLLLATYGVALLMQGIVQYFFTATPKVITVSTASVNVGGAYASRTVLIDVAITAGLIFGLFVLMNRSHIGRQIRAVAGDSMGSTLLGIDSRKIGLITSALGGALSAGAGIVLVTTLYLTPTIGFEQVLKSFTVVIVAGLGNIYRVLILSFALAIAESCASYFGTSTTGHVVGYALITAMLLIRPTGLGTSR